MARATLTTVDRARGLFLGLAAGHALGLDSGSGAAPSPEGARGTRSIRRQDTPESPWGAHVALAIGVAEELLEVEVDLRRLTGRWIAWWRRDGRSLDPETVEALDHLARHDAPLPDQAPGPGIGWVARALPMALATWQQPRNLVSGTYHTIRLATPDTEVAWAAVALNVTVGQFLAGRQDFLPEVIEALKANDASPGLLGLLRRIPFIGPDEWQPREAHPASACAEQVLWLGYHDPNLERAVLRAVDQPIVGETLGAAVGAVLGARDGEGAVPAAWVAALPDPETLRTLAKRLVAARTPL
jgi:ADP-ribosylglycohydrolase